MSKVMMPVAAVITFLASASMVAPCLAQSAGLPKTIWSKSVQTPGDNQYGNETQGFRHGSTPPPAQAPVAQGGGGAAGGGGGYSAPVWHPYARPHRPDPSVEAISADEPVTPNGFPPLPDRLELPVALGWSGGAGAYNPRGGGAGYGAAAAPGMGGGGHQGPRAEGMHQHYQHYDPGAFIPGGQQSAPGMSAPQEHHGYYKVGTPEQFSGGTASASDSGAPKYGGAGGNDLKALGKEPRLNHKNDTASAPDAPTPVVVDQAMTQDLSLPEDEFSSKKQTTKNGTGKNMGRQLGQTMRSVVQSGLSSGMGMMHF